MPEGTRLIKEVEPLEVQSNPSYSLAVLIGAVPQAARDGHPGRPRLVTHLARRHASLELGVAADHPQVVLPGSHPKQERVSCC
jgi:hypothetical protein